MPGSSNPSAQPVSDGEVELWDGVEQYILFMLVRLKRTLKVETTDLQNKAIEAQAQMMSAVIAERARDHYRTALEALTPTEQISKGE